MTTKSDFNNRRKSILKDPISAYIKEFSKENQEKLEHIKYLSGQLISIKKQHTKLQDSTRQLSRLIGEAKKKNNPIEDLKEQTKNKSQQAKSLLKQIKIIEDGILSEFHAAQENKNLLIKNIESLQSSDLFTRNYPDSRENGDKVNISLLETEDQEWNRYVDNNPFASIYHKAEWMTIIKDTFGHQSYYYIARNTQNEIVGVLPLIRLKSKLFGDFLVSMPYFNYGGAIGNHPNVEHQLMAVANNSAKELGVQYIEYRDDIQRPNLPVKTEKVNMLLKLPDSADDLWQNFTPKLRAQIKRPKRENPEITIGGKELLNNFYYVFAKNMRDLGTPVYSKLFFYNILTQFNDNSHIVIIKLHGKPVAAAFLIGYGDTLEIPWASTIRSVNHLSMNMLMYWKVLCFAIDTKYKYFDFGRSSKDSGTYRFKKQWGAQPKPLYWHYWLPEGNCLPALNPSNPKFALMIYIWKRMPVFITKWIGPVIVKYLP